MSNLAEDQLNADNPTEVEIEESSEEQDEGSKYRSYREKTKQKAKAIQKFKIGRGVWLKTDTDGSYPMTVSDARHLPGSNTWEYELKDSMGAIHDEWVAETKLKASSSSSKKK